MIIHIQRHLSYFVQIDSRALEDPRLSWKATGVLSYLLSKPPAWKIQLEHLVRVKPGGRDLVLCALQELARYGYAEVVTERGPDGRFLTRGYVVREEPEGGYVQLPESAKPASILPQSDFPTEENSSVGKSEPSKNDLCSKNDRNARARENDTSDPAPAAALPQTAAQPEPTGGEGEEAAAAEPAQEAATDRPADATLSATPQPGAAEQEAEKETPAPSDTVQPLGGDVETPPPAATNAQPTERPRGYEHLVPSPNDLHGQWLARFPDEVVRDAWWHVGEARLRCKKGAAVIGHCTPSIISEALEAYNEYVLRLKAQGVHVNGTSLFPPQRE